MILTTTTTARRVKFHDARRHFESGGIVVVSEYGHEETLAVGSWTTVHTREDTTWAELVEQVRMWSGRYPNQRYYIVNERPTIEDEAERLLGYWERHGDDPDAVRKWAVEDMLSLARRITEEVSE